ncbi:hypothetical protein NE237_018919 [Protea cynaroides]|uniref:DYW domain-containing protein n=1 Tax=Protea cynaroides TaxID=273540 RepID=A0A9Q0KAW5_9MAGN|nr:hypothetical protein NE237_018919 [Protea cynaroides]
MPMEPDAVIWRVLFSACRIHGSISFGEQIIDYIAQLDPSSQDEGYVFLSNLYASLGQWDKVTGLRTVMNMGGFEFCPACSWIEVNGVIHEFLNGDKMHPQIEEIHDKLNEVLRTITIDGGYVPDTKQVLFDLIEEEKEHALSWHSEKLVVAIGLIIYSLMKKDHVSTTVTADGLTNIFAVFELLFHDPILELVMSVEILDPPLISAKTALDKSPNLLFETAHTYVDDDLCDATTSFFKCFLECLHDECWSSYGVERGYVTFRGCRLPPNLYGLVSGIPKLHSNSNTYALPVLLEVDVDSIIAMLVFISVGSEDEAEMVYPELDGADKDLLVNQQVAALVLLLTVSHLFALIKGDIDWYHNSPVLQEEDGMETLHRKHLQLNLEDKVLQEGDGNVMIHLAHGLDTTYAAWNARQDVSYAAWNAWQDLLRAEASSRGEDLKNHNAHKFRENILEEL